MRSRVTHGVPVIAVRPGAFEPEEDPVETVEHELAADLRGQYGDTRPRTS
ncbi:hypothetical protein [Streptomyces blattellae]|nr:hypothetical protein [Streptomyces blattellae]